MNKIISALDARNNLGSLMDDVNRYNTRIVIKKRNKPSVVLINFADYLENIVKKDPAMILIQMDARQKGLDKLTQYQIDKVISKSRFDHVTSSP